MNAWQDAHRPSMSPFSDMEPVGSGNRSHARDVSVVPVAGLTPHDRNELFALYDRYFRGASPDGFTQDLAAKDLVVLLRCDERVVGFTSLVSWTERLRTACGEEREVIVLYSGDTVVDRDHWGQQVLLTAWGRCAMRLVEDSGLPGYWFLISSGYKTYRMLPVFFREFAPRVGDGGDASDLEVLRTVARRRFGPRYESSRGIIRLGDGVSLKPDVARVDERRLTDPHVAFFLERNPGHARGDELACIARFDRANLTPAGHRLLAGDGSAVPGGPGA